MRRTIEHVYESVVRDGVAEQVALLAAGCPDPAHCAGPTLLLPVGRGGILAPGLHRIAFAALPCPVASLLRRLGEAPVTERALRLVAAAQPARLSDAERADLLRLCARVAVWAETRVADLAQAVSAAAPVCLLPGEDTPLVAEPGAEEVAVALHCSPGAARWRLRAHRDRQVRAPRLAAAMRSGSSGRDQARELDLACAGLPDEGAAWVAERVHPVLLRGTKGEVARAARQQVAVWHAQHPEEPLAPDAGQGELPEPKGGRDARHVIITPAGPGMAWLLALLPAEDAAALMARLDSAAEAAAAGGDPRTPDQVRADTLGHFGWHGLPHPDLLPFLDHHPGRPPGGSSPGGAPSAGPPAHDAPSHAPPGFEAEPVHPTPAAAWAPATRDETPTGPTPTPAAPGALSDHDGGAGIALALQADPALAAAVGRVVARVHVTVDLATLLGLRAETADLATAAPGHRGQQLGPVFADVARALAASRDADWQRFLHDDTGLLHGVSVAHRVPPVLHRTVLAAYTTCTTYGCTRPAAECEDEHIEPWRADGNGGATTFANLHMADRRHHNHKTHGNWRVSRADDGTLTWTSPADQTVTVHPADYRPPSRRGTPSTGPDHPRPDLIWPGSNPYPPGQWPDEPPFS